MNFKALLPVTLIFLISACTHNTAGLPSKEVNREEVNQKNNSKFIDLSTGKVVDATPKANMLPKNSDGVATSSLPFDSEIYLKCANIVMQKIIWNSVWSGYNCDNAVYFLNSEERLIYANKDAIHSSSGNNTIIPTSPDGSLITISTMSEDDSEDSTVIVIRFTDKDGEHATLYIPETERFMIDIDYRISIYNKKNGGFIEKGYVKDLILSQ